MKAVFYQDEKRIDIVQSNDIESGDIVLIVNSLEFRLIRLKKMKKDLLQFQEFFKS